MRRAKLPTLLAALAGLLVGCGKDYKPEANPKGGGVHEPIEIDLPRPANTGSSGSTSDGLQGRWRVTRIELSATASFSLPADKPVFVTFSGNRVTFDGDGKLESGTFRTKPGTREIDITGTGILGPGGLETAEGLYQLEGNNLRIAFQMGKAGGRPTEVRASAAASKDNGLGRESPQVMVMHLQRAGGAGPSAPSSGARIAEAKAIVEDDLPEVTTRVEVDEEKPVKIAPTPKVVRPAPPPAPK